MSLVKEYISVRWKVKRADGRNLTSRDILKGVELNERKKVIDAR
jgi:hypothetical protein